MNKGTKPAMTNNEALQNFQSGLYTINDLNALLGIYRNTKNYLEFRKVRIAMKRLQIAQILKQNNPLRIQVLATSDDEKNEFRKYAWGDYWLQYELISHLGNHGYEVTRENPVITLHLFGFPRKIPANTYNVVWCTSHPELLTPDVCFHYDQIFTLGSDHATELRQNGFNAFHLCAASSKKPYPIRDQKYPAVFIGNVKPNAGMRPCVEMLKDSGYPFIVWGWGWENYLPPRNIGGKYVDYHQTDKIYALSAFVLNDHHQEMTRVGMVSPKNFDVCSSGGLLVCEKNRGLYPIFEESVPQFSCTEELKKILFSLDQDLNKRETLRNKSAEISLQYTFERLVQQLSAHLIEGCTRPLHEVY